MTPEELAADAFGAYLGSIGLDEKRWRAERRAEAEESARCDLLLEAVAEAEGITAVSYTHLVTAGWTPFFSA